jgi:hypothetical protein
MRSKIKVKNSTSKLNKINEDPIIKNTKLMIEYKEFLQKITIVAKK